MKNITVAIDDDTYRRARIKAAQNDTSVSALFKEYLNAIAKDESEFERLEKLEMELRNRVAHFSAAQRLSREDVYRREF